MALLVAVAAVAVGSGGRGGGSIGDGVFSVEVVVLVEEERG